MSVRGLAGAGGGTSMLIQFLYFVPNPIFLVNPDLLIYDGVGSREGVKKLTVSSIWLRDFSLFPKLNQCL